MGTRAKIRIKTEGRSLCAKYYHMDGHVHNWAPTLIVALNRTTPEDILKNSQLLRFMFDDDERDDFPDYLCEIDISEGDYNITIYGYKNKLLFQGGLDDFSDKYNDIH